MTPGEYIEVVVVPTIRDLLQKPDDRRLAYLAAIATQHVVDYVMRANIPGKTPPKVRDAELKRIKAAVEADVPDFFAVVEGMCHGSKHCGRDGKGHQFTPGDEQYVPPFGFGEGFGGLGQGRWNGPGLVVILENGERVFVDTAVVGFLLACQRLFGQHISGIDSSSWAPKPNQ